MDSVRQMATLTKDIRFIKSDEDVAIVRQAVKALATEHSFSVLNTTKMVTAASELARNAWEHGGGGVATLEVVNDGLRTGIRLTFQDNGKGIADLEAAMRDGFTTGRGMGLGLGGAKRLMDEFEIATNAGEGTRVVVTKWK